MAQDTCLKNVNKRGTMSMCDWQEKPFQTGMD